MVALNGRPWLFERLTSALLPIAFGANILSVESPAI